MASYIQFYTLCSLCPCFGQPGKPMQYFLMRFLFIYGSNDRRSAPKFLGQSEKLCDDEVFRKTSPLMSPGSSTVTDKCLKHKIRCVCI